MKFKFLSTIFVILICSVSGLAKANQITLDTSNVIGSSGAFDNRFLAKYVLDNQTGSITETEQNANDVNGGYWLQSVAPGANTVSWFTIDLGSAFNIDFIELFNTHNISTAVREISVYWLATRSTQERAISTVLRFK
jgi:hypothetical protein